MHSTLLREGKDVRIQQEIHQKYLNLSLALYYYCKVIFELEKTNKEFNCAYGTCTLTK